MGILEGVGGQAGVAFYVVPGAVVREALAFEALEQEAGLFVRWPSSSR